MQHSSTSEQTNLFHRKSFILTGNIITTKNDLNKEIWVRKKHSKPMLVSSCSSDKTIRIWNLKAKKCIKTLLGHTNYVTSLLNLPESGELASASVDCTIKIWNIKNACIVRTIQAHQNWIENLALIKNKLIASGDDEGTIKIWDYFGNCVNTLNGHLGDVKMCVELANAKLVSVSWDASLKVWNTNDGECLRTIETRSKRTNMNNKTTGLYCILVWENQVDLIIGCDDASILYVNINFGDVRKVLRSHSDCVLCLQKLTCTQFVSGSGDRSIRIWDYEMGACLKTIINAHSSWINYLLVLPTGDVLSCSNDTTLKLWNLEANKTKCIQTLRGHTSGVNCLAIV
jgi:WD40 repeat protein